MNDYKPSFGTRLRWTLIPLAVLWIILLVYAAISDGAVIA